MSQDGVAERISEFTLEIVYLLTGEEHVVVKKSGQYTKDGSLKTQTPSTEPPPNLPIHERRNEQKILELTNKIIHLLTGEVWQYLEGHKDLYKDVIARNHQPVNLHDSCKAKTSPSASPTFDSSSPRLKEETSKVSRGSVTDSSVICTPRLGNGEHSDVSGQSVQYEGCNLNDVDIYTLQEHARAEYLVEGSTSCGEGNPSGTEIYSPQELTEAGYLSTHIKEEPTSCDDGDLNNIDLYSPAEYLSTNVKEEFWEEGLRDTSTYPLLGHSQAEFSSSQLEEPTSSGKGDPTNSDLYPPTDRLQIGYPSSQDEEMSSTKSSLPALLSYPRENSFTIFDRDESLPKTSRVVQPKRTDSKSYEFSCLECGKSGGSKFNLTCHQDVHVEGKCCNRKAALDSHPNVHAGFKPYPCSECGKRFSEKSYLPRHFRVHTGDKPYACPECGKSFRSQSNLTRHRQSHKGEKPYSCVECGKCFTRKSYLEQHVRTHTGDKPYSCSECGKVFHYQSNFVRHRRIHMGVKPYCCPECGRCFSQKTHLELHQTLHTGKKPYSCPQCGKCFTQKSHLFAHQRTHFP